MRKTFKLRLERRPLSLSLNARDGGDRESPPIYCAPSPLAGCARAAAMNDNLTADRPTFVTHLECSLTGERYEADELHNLSRAGRPLLVRYDLAAVGEALEPRCARGAADRSVALARAAAGAPDRRASSRSARSRRRSCRSRARAGASVLVKDEGRLPTGSFKARGLVMAVAMARELGVTRIAMPTNGNAGAALAAYAARCGIETIILAPQDTPEVNIREIAAQGGAGLSRQRPDRRMRRARRARRGRRAWFDFSTLKEPYRIEGKKTMGLELAEQLGWKLPDAIFYPTGGGTGLIGMWKAFDELEALGWIGPEAAADVRRPGVGLRADRARVRSGRGACRAVGRARRPSRRGSACPRRSATS